MTIAPQVMGAPGDAAARPVDSPVTLITGGTRGIGRAIAERLLQRGHRVALTFYRNSTAAAATLSELEEAHPERVCVLKGHIGDEETPSQMVEQTLERYGRLDTVISNAASGVLKPLLETTERHWDFTLDVNARALLRLAQSAAAHMERSGGGHILALTSAGSTRVMPGYGLVGTAKAAIESLVRYLAVELAPRGISVNAVSPGVVVTGALDHFPNRELMIDESLRRTPAGRLATPEDVAGVVEFLLSPAAHMIRGQAIVVDGGCGLLA